MASPALRRGGDVRGRGLLQELGERLGESPDRCRRVEAAGASGGASFVGAAAASLVVAEALRMAHGGPRLGIMLWSLAAPDRITAQPGRIYNPPPRIAWTLLRHGAARCR